MRRGRGSRMEGMGSMDLERREEVGDEKGAGESDGREGGREGPVAIRSEQCYFCAGLDQPQSIRVKIRC